MKLNEFLKQNPHLEVKFSCKSRNHGEPVFRIEIYNRTYSAGEPVFVHLVNAFEIDAMFVDFETAMITAANNWLVSKKQPTEKEVNLMRKMMKQALYTPISEVYYCDHIMDNTFVRSRLYETEWALEDRGYIPVGYCAEPEYSPSSGVAFVVKDKHDNTLWAHVPKTLFRSWLRELQLDWKEHPIWKKIVAKGGMQE